MRRSVLLSILGLLALVMFLEAEYTFFTPPGSYAVEVSLENSNYLRLPIYRNAITSLAVVGDYAVGGTSASPDLSPFVFAVSLSKRRLERVVDVSKVVPGQRAILSGFEIGSPGTLYAGTMPDRPGASGHLIEIKVSADRLTVEEKGIPVEGEGVFSIVADVRAPVIYGISHPSGKFFAFDLQARQTHLFPETAPSRQTLTGE